MRSFLSATSWLTLPVWCLVLSRMAMAQAPRPAEASPSPLPLGITDGQSLQREVDRFGMPHGLSNKTGIIRLPRGRIVLDRPLNLRKLSGLTLVGEGPWTVLEAQFPAGASHEARKWPILDLTGSARITLRDFSINTGSDPARSCGCGILQAREAGESSGWHMMENVQVGGFFGGAALWNAASEVNTYIGCFFTNFKSAPAPTAGGWCVFFGNGKKPGDDPEKLNPPYSLIRCPDSLGTYRGPAYDSTTHKTIDQSIISYGTSTMQQTTLYNCHFAAHQGYGHGSDLPNGNSVNIMIHCNPNNVVTDLHFIGGGMVSRGTDLRDPRTCAFAAICIDSSSGSREGQIENISFENMRCETWSCKYWLYVSERSRDINNLVIRNNWVTALESAFKFDLASRCGPTIIEGNFITSTAQYEWKSPERAVYDSIRDIGLVMRSNVIPSLTPADPTKPNLIYRCREFSENCTIEAASSASVSLPPKGTWGMLLDEYRMPDRFSTGGLRRLRLGSSDVPGGSMVPNVEILTTAPADDPAKYKDGDVVFANIGGVFRMYLRGGGAWHHADMVK